ncbi:hypothetical protein [Brevibacillus agri]|uniref:hypothetical protein n=1 Tax=Brevibacillus agri TaxID=51101 RepID=UPI002868257B|nr:hypothetical protein [Brevibacillus agri]
MSRARTPNRFGTDMRARRRTEPAQAAHSECITRPMTPEERAWMESLPKPHKKDRIIGMSIAAEKAMKRKRGHTG